MSTLISKNGEINTGIVGGRCSQDLSYKRKGYVWRRVRTDIRTTYRLNFLLYHTAACHEAHLAAAPPTRLKFKKIQILWTPLCQTF